MKSDVAVSIPSSYRTIPILQEGKSYSPAKKDFPYNPAMDRVRELVKRRAAEQQKTLAELSKAIGRNHAYLQQFVKRGVPATLPEEIRPKLARLLRVEEQDLRSGSGRPLGAEIVLEPEAPNERAAPTVKVVGYVGAGATANYYNVPGSELDTVSAPEGATPETVAVEIRGNSLGELFDRWLVFYDQVRRPVTPDLLGRLCVVGLPDDRVLVKKIRRGHNGLFDLHSNTEEPIRGVEIEWAARVKNMVPR